MTRLLVTALAAAAGVAATAVRPLPAQSPPTELSVPRHEPLSPAVVARSGLFAPSFPTRRPGAWRVSADVDYGSAVERNLNWPDAYLLDAELVRVQLRARREVGARAYIEVQGGVQGAFAGVSDAFFERYHEVIGWVMEERDTRPRNVYGDRLLLRRLAVERDAAASGARVADVRATAGLHHGPDVQSLLSVTLPTASGDGLLARGVPTVSLVHARRLALGDRVVAQGTVGVGWAPRTGELASVQRTLIPMGALGTRVRLAGGHGVYASIFVHDAPYGGTGFPELDDAEVSVDFGYVWRSRGGREWRVGLTEDTRRRDPGIDLVFKLGVE